MPTDSTIESNRAIALKFCSFIKARRFDLTADLFTEDAGWYIVANKNRAPYGGTVNAKERAKWAGDVLKNFEEFAFEILSTTAEEDRVIIEGVSRGRGPGVIRYDNNYMMKFTIRKGKIVDYKEFVDAYEVEEWAKSKEEQQRLNEKDLEIEKSQ